MKLRHAALAGLLIAQPLAAQQDNEPVTGIAADAAAPAAIAPQPTVLRAGTEVPLRLTEELTTEGKQLEVGDRFSMATEQPLMIDGYTVIPAGTPAVGEITDVRNKGMWGKSGKLNARLLYLTVNGRQIRINGAFDDRGVSGAVGAVAVSAIVFAPAGFFMTGTSARVPAGTVIRGYIAEDVQVPGAHQASAAALAAVRLPPAPQSEFRNPPHRRPPSASNP